VLDPASSAQSPPTSGKPDEILDEIARAGLRGRGGAGFPAATKWRSVRDAPGTDKYIVANGAEGEPGTFKDRTVMRFCPYEVIEGAAIAAHAVGATAIYVALKRSFTREVERLRAAVDELEAAGLIGDVPIQIVEGPDEYLFGEETGALEVIEGNEPLPRVLRPYQHGLFATVPQLGWQSHELSPGHEGVHTANPTVVSNVETLAHVGLIARFGDAWFHSLGAGDASGTTLITVGGAVPQTAVIEVAQGTAVTDAVNAAGGLTAESDAVLLGGYFGGWIESSQAWGLVLEPEQLRAHGHSLGCGVIAVLPAGRCGVVETGRILAYLAHESARQCGPCTFGLRAISSATGRIAALASSDGDFEHIQRWAGLLPGRGACKHPDGAAGLLGSALRVFADEFRYHELEHRCRAVAAVAVAS